MASLADKVQEKGLIEKIKEKVEKFQENEDDSTEIEQEPARPFKKEFEKDFSKSSSSSDSGEKKGLYKSLEEKWYGFLDSLEEKGIPVYKIIDPIENVVPSFPLFIVFVLLFLFGLIVLIFFLVGGGFSQIGLTEYSFSTVDDLGNAIAGVKVNILASGEEFNSESDAFGEFSIKLPSNNVSVTATKDSFEDFHESMVLSTTQKNEISLNKKTIGFVNKTLKIYFNGVLYMGSAIASFTCSNHEAVSPDQRTNSIGVISDIPVPENCGTLSFRIVADGFLVHNCHEFLPNEGSTVASGPLITILREGRQPGISLVLATQQPGKMHTDVITQSDIVIAHRLTAKIDTQALGALMQSYMRESLDKQLNYLPTDKGAALIFDDNNERLLPIRVRPRYTWHGGATPSIVVKEKKVFEF